MILWSNVFITIGIGIILYVVLLLATNYVALFGAPAAHNRHKILMKAKEEQNDSN